MVSRVEYFNTEYNDWFLKEDIVAGKFAFFTNNRGDGTCEIIVINCSIADTQTYILKAPKDAKIIDEGLLVPNDAVPKVLSVLNFGKPAYIFSVTPDGFDEEIFYQVSHI